MKTCPSHNRPLVSMNTRYGLRWGCTIPGCTVACWEGSTSTPADEPTRKARMRFHAMFDPLWQRNGRRKGVFRHGCGPGDARRRAYGWLAKSMDIDGRSCHGGMFTREQCLRACELIEALLAEEATCPK